MTTLRVLAGVGLLLGAGTVAGDAVRIECVSRVGQDRYLALDNTHIMTQGCSYDARCVGVSIEYGQVKFDNGYVCTLRAVWRPEH